MKMILFLSTDFVRVYELGNGRLPEQTGVFVASAEGEMKSETVEKEDPLPEQAAGVGIWMESIRGSGPLAQPGGCFYAETEIET